MALPGAIADGDREALTELLAKDVVFRSPVATYRGRDEVVHLLATIGGVLDDMAVTREVGTVTFVTARVGDHELDGMLDEIRGEDGRVVEVALMLRPLAALQVAAERMAAALQRS